MANKCKAINVTLEDNEREVVNKISTEKKWSKSSTVKYIVEYMVKHNLVENL